MQHNGLQPRTLMITLGHNKPLLTPVFPTSFIDNLFAITGQAPGGMFLFGWFYTFL